MNMGIFLKQFKRSNQAIVDDIRSGNSQPYGAEPLRELMKLLPEAEEVKKMKAYSGDVSKLSLADSFLFLLVQLPSYATRVECMLYKEEIPGACEALRGHIGVLRTATKEVLNCRELHAILHLVLQAGNILDAGGQAAGFKLSSLLSLAETKANKPGMNLLHFVALEAQKKEEELLDFPLKLSHIQAASRISLETLDSELQLLTSRTRALEEKIRTDGELLRQLDGFLRDATGWLRSLRGGRRLLSEEAGELMNFFCEDDNTFRPDECFAVLHAFCCKFSRAVKENKEQEAREQARRRRLQALEEQKRHSWAGGEEVTGAMGLYCRSETDLSQAGSPQDDTGALLELLSPRSGSRRVLRGRSRLSPTQHPSSTLTLSVSDLERHGNAEFSSVGGGISTTLLRKNSATDNRARDASDNVAAILEKCSLVPEPKAFDDASCANAAVSLASDEMAKDTAWCITVLCEAEHPVAKNTPSISAPVRSEPVSSQPSPSSPPRVYLADPPQKSEATRTKRVRTLNSSEKQSMRRVVPISRTAKDKRGEKPSSNLRARDPKDRLAPGPRSSPGEKMCRSSLRATGGGTVVSGTAATPPPAPRFARNTASSSLRQTHSNNQRSNVPKCPSEASIRGHSRASSSMPKRTQSARTSVNTGVTTPDSPVPAKDKSSQSQRSTKICRPSWR
nr:FH2 domain-containing protein 1-like [Nerophis lumbriciformis]